jgi:lactate permease
MQDLKGGPWGNLADLLFAFFPILFILYVTLKKGGMSSSISLPFAAFLVYVIRLTYFRASPNLLHASIVAGMLDAITPITIVAAAVFLFETMDRTKCMEWILGQLRQISRGHKIGQTMLIGYAFTYLVEGCSGFGTPTALAAPILAQMGDIEAFDAVIVCLIFNSLETPFGAVGTPIWFGLGSILDEQGLSLVAVKTQVILCGLSFVVPILALSKIAPLREIWNNKGFILASIMSAILPALALSTFSYELPTIVGGACSLIVTGFILKKRWGISESKNIHIEGKDEILNEQNQDAKDQVVLTAARSENTSPYWQVMIAKTFPLWALILSLSITRIPALGIRKVLTDKNPAMEVQLGSFALFRVSNVLVFQLEQIFGQSGSKWSYNALFVPALFPTVIICLVTFWIHREEMESPWSELKSSLASAARKMKSPTIALIGATSLVSLFTFSDSGDPTSIPAPGVLAGSILAQTLKYGWICIAVIIGSIGSFFSGSTTVSNLTFGQVQATAAETIGVPVTAMLALQTIGGSMGNMFCIHNILSAKVVVGLDNISEGVFIRRMLSVLAVFTVVATLVGLIFMF